MALSARWRAALGGALALTAAACSSGDSGSGADAGDQPWLHATPAWSSLYGEYFGPTGVASCAVNGAMCHGSPDQAGSVASNFVCADKDACYQSLTGASNLVAPTKDVMAPSGALLLKKLRTPGGAGSMPSMSSFEFQSQDFDLITTWIGKGAKDD